MPSKQPPGRPRDPAIAERSLRAAQRVYGRVGLAGFTFDAVAAEAGVGKPALYRRWDSREELLRDALLTYSLVPDPAVHHDLRTQLIELAVNTLTFLRSEEGAAMLRVFIERRAAPELFDEIAKHLRTVTHAATTGMVAAAVDRGDVSPDTDPDAVIETITGAAYMHSTLDATNATTETVAGARHHSALVVDMVLRGIGYTGTT